MLRLRCHNNSLCLSLRINDLPADVRLLLNDSLQQIQYFISPYGASQLVNIIKSKSYSATQPNTRPLNNYRESSFTDEIQRNPQSSRADICCAGSLDTVGVSPSVLASTESGGGGSLYSRCGKVGKVLYSVGAVFAAYEFYSSFNKAKELTKWLQRLRDSAGRILIIFLFSVKNFVLQNCSNTMELPRKCSISALTCK